VRVVIDTNLWVRFFMGQQSGRLKQHLENPRLTAFTGSVQREELKRVLARPRVQAKTGSDADSALLPVYDTLTKSIKVTEHIDVCRDPKDNYLLELAVTGKVDAIVTADKDLLSLHPFRGIAIIPYGEFERRLTELSEA